MKNLFPTTSVLATAFAVAALVGPGCGTTGSAITVSWNVLVGGLPAACDAGVDTARIVLHPTTGGSDLIDLYNCTDHGGTSVDVPDGQYVLFVELTNNSGSLVNAQSLSETIDVNGVDFTVTPAFDIHLDKGYFQLAWGLHAGASATTCGAEGADAVSITSTVTGGSTLFDSEFACENGGGVSDALPAGSYTVSVSANNSAGASLGTAPAQSSEVVDDHNAVTDLGTFDIGIGEFSL